jgi:hypothetical protein
MISDSPLTFISQGGRALNGWGPGKPLERSRFGSSAERDALSRHLPPPEDEGGNSHALLW